MVLKLGCIGCLDVIVIGFNSVEELYPSPPLGVDSADTSQLPKEKNLHGKSQLVMSNQRFFKIVFAFVFLQTSPKS